MSTLKKVLALTLALAMVLSLNVFAAFKDQDKIDTDCVDAVNMMADLGVLKGDENGNVNPTSTITRAEAATMIFRLMNKGNNDATIYEGGKVFTDVAAGIWYDGYVNYGFSMGIIAGKTPTTFDPNAPVTGYEIAKMLLTCMNYNQSTEGYTGANWQANVQIDAFNAGLLEDYGQPLTAPAQRQWVAFMFMNALDCLTVKYSDGEAVETETTLGYKKFGLTTDKGVLVSINGMAVLPGFSGEEDYSTITTDGTAKNVKNYEKLADTALLGQQVKVVYNAKTDKVYSIRATSKNTVATAALTDVSYSSTTEKYTIGKLTAALDTGAGVYTNNTKCKWQVIGGDLTDKVGADSNATVTAIDNDNDGKIEYVLVTASQFGEVDIDKAGDVTLLGTSVAAADVADTIKYVNTVADGDFVKVTANVFTEKYDIEALTGKNMAFTGIKAGTYKLDGTYYTPSADVADTNYAALISNNYGDTMTVYFDGSFIVKAATYTETTTSMPTNMALVTKVGSKTDAYGTTTPVVKLLTLDGKVTEYSYYKSSSATGMLKTAIDNTKVNTIVEYVVNSDGTVYFKNSVTTPSKTVGANLTAGTIDVSTGRYGNAKFDTSAKFFIYSATDDAYSVGTFSSFKSDIKVTAASYMFKYTPTSGIASYVAGFFYVDSTVKDYSDMTLAVSTSNIYTGIDDGDTYTYIDVKYADGTTATLTVADGDETTAGIKSWSNTSEETASGEKIVKKMVYWVKTDSDGYSKLYAFAANGDYDSTNSNKALTVVDGSSVVINGTIFDLSSTCKVVVKKTYGTPSIAFGTAADALMTNTTTYTYTSTAFFTYDSDTNTITNLYVEIARTTIA